MVKITIAVDGPAGAGKSTIAKTVAQRLGVLYIDTGAMYRAVTLSIIRNHIDLSNIHDVEKLVESLDVFINSDRVFLNGEDVTAYVRTDEINKLVSQVSTIPFIRNKLVELQRNMALNNSIIMDGRDIGTNVLVNAKYKIFLTASVDERAKRRYMELKKKGYEVDYSVIKQDICRRDEIDSSREINPLTQADDALVIDTTCKTIEDVVDEILNIVKKG